MTVSNYQTNMLPLMEVHYSIFYHLAIEYWNMKMKDSMHYVKIVEWSDEDQCYVGSCPGLFYGGCHGNNEKEVCAELCEIVEETIELYKKEGKPLPPPTAGKDYANRMLEIA